MRTIVLWIAATAAGVTLLIVFQVTRPAGEEGKGGPPNEGCRPATATAASPAAQGCEGDENNHQGGKPGERK